MQGQEHITAVMEGLHARISNLEMLSAKIKPAKPKRRPEQITQNMVNLRKLKENSPQLYELYQVFHKGKPTPKLLQNRYGIDGAWVLDEFSKTSVFGFGHINGDELDFSITPHVDTFKVDDMLSSIKEVNTKTQREKTNSEHVFKVDDMLTSIDDIENTDSNGRVYSGSSNLFELQVFEDPNYKTLSKTKYVSNLHEIKGELNSIFKWNDKENTDEDTRSKMLQDDEDDDELLQQFQKSATLHNTTPQEPVSLLDFLKRGS